MIRQSISFTKPNDEWLKEQVNKEEYSSKSELINDLVRQARKQQAKDEEIKDKSESSTFNDDSKSQILEQTKSPVIG